MLIQMLLRCSGCGSIDSGGRSTDNFAHMKLWHYTKMGLQQGPVPEDELRQKIRRGEIGEATLVWHEGMADWLPLSQVPALQEANPAVPVMTPPLELPPHMPATLPQVAAPPGNVPLPQPPAYHGDYVAPQISNYMWQSIVALVISIGMMLVICLPIGMPFAIVALVYATKVEGLRAQGNFIEAQSASTSAKTWMIISYVLSGLIFLGFMGMILLVVIS